MTKLTIIAALFVCLACLGSGCVVSLSGSYGLPGGGKAVVTLASTK